MEKNTKTPVLTQSLAASGVETVSAESLTFFTLAGAADSGEAAGSIVYGKLAKSPVLNLLGDTIGEFNPASNFATSIVFTTDVMDADEEVGFVYRENLDDRLSDTVARLANAPNGAWACHYQTGLIVLKKASSSTSQTITSYKVLSSNATANTNVTGFGGAAVTLGQKTSANSIPVVLPSDAPAAAGSTSSGDNTYLSPADFIATYASGTTLTLTGIPFTPTNAQFASVKKVTVGTTAVTYTPDVNIMSYDSLTGVLTVAGATFAANDTFVVTIMAGPPKRTDQLNDAMVINPIRDVSDNHRALLMEDIANIPNGTPWVGYVDVSGLETVYFDFNALSGTDSKTLTIGASARDDGTVDSSCTYGDISEHGVKPTTQAAAAASYTTALGAFIPCKGMKFLRFTITTAGGAGDGAASMLVRGAY